MNKADFRTKIEAIINIKKIQLTRKRNEVDDYIFNKIRIEYSIACGFPIKSGEADLIEGTEHKKIGEIMKNEMENLENEIQMLEEILFNPNKLNDLYTNMKHEIKCKFPKY